MIYEWRKEQGGENRNKRVTQTQVEKHTTHQQIVHFSTLNYFCLFATCVSLARPFIDIPGHTLTVSIIP